MDNFFTSGIARTQNRWLSLPWGTVFFILAVFAYATPLFGVGFWAEGPVIQISDVFEVVDILEKGNNWARIVALILLGAFSLFNLLRSKPGRFQVNGLLGWLILFYLAWAVLSIIWSVDTRFTLKRAGILILLSLGALYVAGRFSLRETMVLVFFVNTIFLLHSIILIFPQYFHPLSSWWRFGGNMHPISQGWHCGLLVLSAFALYKIGEKNRAGYLAMVFIAFFFLVLTRARMAFASCVISMAVYLSLAPTKRHQAVLFFLGIIIIGCSMYLVLGDGFLSMGNSLMSFGRGGEGMESVDTLSGRIPLWKVLLPAVGQNPLLGYGYDSFLTSNNLLRINEELNWAATSAHSGYMETLLGLGVTGGILLVSALFQSVKLSVGLARRDSDYAFMAAVLVWLICNLFTEGQVLTRPYFAVFVWMIMLAKLGFLKETAQEMHDGRTSD